MKMELSRYRWIACIVALLLLCIVGSDKPLMGSGQPAVAQCECAAEEVSGDAAISSPEDDIFTHLRTTNRFGFSSNTLHLQTPTARSASSGNPLQRTIREAESSLYGNGTAENLNHTQCHTIASIRFHIGYFIYHRCQMRC